MEEDKYKDIEYKEKVLFEGKVTLNPNSKNTEVADCSVTEGSVIIESTEPLHVPLDRVEECHIVSHPTMIGTKVEVGSSTVTLRYRTASGESKKIEFEMNWEEAGDLNATIDMTKGRMLHARRAGEILYVGFWRRFFANLVDGIIMSIINTIILLLVTDWLTYIIDLVYVIGFWTWKGQTPGKMLLGIKIVKVDGSPIGIGTAILRYVGYFISAIIIFIGYLMIAWDSKKQGLHDKIASTYVVEVE